MESKELNLAELWERMEADFNAIMLGNKRPAEDAMEQSKNGELVIDESPPKVKPSPFAN